MMIPASGQLSTVELLSILVSLLVALSVASERLVEIVKGLVPPLGQENKSARKEGYRQSTLQFLAVVAGIITSFLARPAIEGILPDPWDKPSTYLALGFLTSGGSGFWNGILSYVKNVKDIRKSELLKLREG